VVACDLNPKDQVGIRFRSQTGLPKGIEVKGIRKASFHQGMWLAAGFVNSIQFLPASISHRRMMVSYRSWRSADYIPTFQVNATSRFNTKLVDTVRVVDDKEDIVEVTVAHLSEMGLTALHVNDGPSPLKEPGKHDEIDMMITDIVMPGVMNGAELLKRTRDLRPALSIIYTSRLREEALVEKTSQLHHGPLSRKPYQGADFAANIQFVTEASVENPSDLENVHFPAKLMRCDGRNRNRARGREDR
jgi:CheY-like chemotaxis protein